MATLRARITPLSVIAAFLLTGAVPVIETAAGPAALPRAEAAAAGVAALGTPTLVNGNGAALSWDRFVPSATAPFTAYQVHRGSTSTFTPTAATMLTSIADLDTTTWTDVTARPATTFTYKLVVGAAVSAAVTVTTPAAGTSRLTLQPAGADGKSSQVVHDVSAPVACSDERNYGASTTMRIGTSTSGWMHRGLLKFDLRTIPAKATITKANLTLWYPGTAASANAAMSVHRLRQPWSEGAGTAGQCDASGTTWTQTQRGVNWATAGTSFDSTAAASLAAKARTTAGSDTYSVLALTKDWVAGTYPNHGVLLRYSSDTVVNTTTNPFFDYYADDLATTSTTAQRPQLVVEYANPEVASAAPSVTLASPTPGPVRGSVKLAAAVGDDGAVTKVEYFQGTTLLATANAAPWTATWDTAAASVVAGTYSITARATDNAGTTTTSPAASVTVDKSAAPTITLTGPAAGTVVTTSTTMTANVTGTGVTRVEFYADDKLVGTDTAAPWSAPWNTASVSDPGYNGAQHQLSARVFDGAGRTATTADTTVSVSRAGATPYSATLELNEPGNSTTAIELPPTFLDNDLAPVSDPYSGSTTTGSLSSAPKDSTSSYASYSGSLAPQRAPSKSATGTAPQMTEDTTTVKPIRDPESVARGALLADVTVTNTSTVPWKGGSSGLQLWYRWYVPTEVPKGDGSPGDDGVILFEGPANTYFPSTVQPGQSKPIPVLIEPPTVPQGIDKAKVRLRIDIYDVDSTSADKWFASKGNEPIDQPVVVNRDLEGALGLERYWQYEGEDTGAGSSTLTNVANGNVLWRWSPFMAPGRGLATMLDLTYNSLEDHSESPAGNNVSMSISGLTRWGMGLDIHPNKADTISGRSNKFVTLTDGDGTTHRFTGTTQADGTTSWTEPAGVNLFLMGPSTDPTRQWSLTRPDKTTYYFDDAGFPTSVVDRNGNALTFTLAPVTAGEDPGGPKKRITRVTDAAGRYFDVDYFTKAEVKRAQVRGKVESVKDHTGSLLKFEYYDDGNLRRLVQVGGTNPDGTVLPDRSFVFTYTTSNGAGPAIPLLADRADPAPRTPNQSTKVYSIRDPKGQETVFAYYGPGSGQLRWKVLSRWNRLGDPTAACTGTNHCTGFTYDIAARRTTVNAPQARDTDYLYDTLGRVSSIVDPLEHTTSVVWSPDNKVSQVTEPGGGIRTWTYNANGYLTSATNQENETSTLTYENRSLGANDSAGHWSLLKSSTRPEGGVWSFLYEGSAGTAGNITKVTDAEGFSRSYTWNLQGSSAPGTIASSTDGRAATTSYSYDPSGQPSRINQPAGVVVEMGYDADGLLRWTQGGLLSGEANPDGDGDAADRTVSAFQDYDPFHRLVRQSAPKSAAQDRTRLIWSSVGLDANDNVVRNVDAHYGGAGSDSTAGAVSTTTYDAMGHTLKQVNPEGDSYAYTWDTAGRLVTRTQPLGVASATAGDYSTAYSYDELDRILTQTDYGTSTAQVHRVHSCFDLAGNLRSVTSPRAGLTTAACPGDGPLVAAFTTTYVYDKAHRVVSQSDPLGHQQRKTYDDNGNVTVVETEIDKAAAPTRVKRTETVYDKRDLPVQTTQLFDGTRKLVSKAQYDANGNKTLLASPRAVEQAAGSTLTASSPFVVVNGYDALNRLVRTTAPFAPGETERQYSHRAYDAGSNLVWTSLPTTTADPALVAAGAKTVMTYWDPGWVRTSTKPTDPKVTFDYAAQSWQTRRTPERRGQPGVPDLDKEMIWRYSPDGRVVERADRDGNPSTYDYDLNNNLVHALDTSGVSDANESPIETKISWSGFGQTERVWHREKAASTTPWTFSDYTYDPNGNVTRRLENGEQDSAFASVTKAPTEVQLTYDGADWLQNQVDRGKTDLALATVPTDCKDDQYVVNTFYDTGLEKSRTIQRAAATCTGTPTSWPVKQKTTWTHFDNGKLKSLSTTNGSGSVLEKHDVEYFESATFTGGTTGQRYENGNRTVDRYVIKRADAATTCADVASPCVADYDYDARERVVRHQRRAGVVDTYQLDQPANLVGDTSIRAGNVTTESKAGQPTVTRKYSSNQLKEATSGGATTSYVYDNWGNVDCVAVGAGISSCPTTGLVVDYAYDDLNRLMTQKSYGGGSTVTDSADYSHDALDRVVKEVENHAGTTDDRTTDFSYQGLSSLSTQEKQSGGTKPKTKTFSYDAYGHRISMTDTTNGTTTTDTFTYSYDVHGSVSQLVTDTGAVKASYGYDAYGGEDSGLSSKQDATADTNTAPLNPYRFQSRRLDSGSATATSPGSSLDMGARRYGADTGRFLQQDMFASALGDLGLTLDPLSQNSYSLAGGNPVSFVEVDGHMVIADGGGGGSRDPSPPPIDRETARNNSGVDDIEPIRTVTKCAGGWVCNTYEEKPQADVDWAQLGKDVSGIQDAQDCSNGSVSGCIWTAIAVTPGKAFKVGKLALFTKLTDDALSVSKVWKENPFKRGVMIEDALGHNLPRNFPKIDKWDSAAGKATSIKSIDTTAKSYADPKALERQLTGYVDDVAGFKGRSWAGTTIEAKDIKARELEIAVPEGGVHEDQLEALQNTVDYAASQGVQVKFWEVP